MTDATEAQPTAEKPARKPARHRKKARRPRASTAATPTAAKPDAGDLAGLTATKCPAACTAERCVISTVGVCKHPLIAPDSGCGPVTMANRAKALKIIKRQKIEAA